LSVARRQYFRFKVAIIYRQNVFSHNVFCVLDGLLQGSRFP
jgi:hypothetical protein